MAKTPTKADLAATAASNERIAALAQQERDAALKLVEEGKIEADGQLIEENTRLDGVVAELTELLDSVPKAKAFFASRTVKGNIALGLGSVAVILILGIPKLVMIGVAAFVGWNLFIRTKTDAPIK